jgi:hypothetical protein
MKKRIALVLLWIFALDLSGQERNDEEYFFDEKRSEIDRTGGFLIGLGHKYRLYSDNIYTFGTYTILEYQGRNAYFNESIRFGIQTQLKLFKFVNRAAKYNDDFINDIISHPADLSGMDSLYQRSFFNMITHPIDSSGAQGFVSFMVSQQFVKLGRGTGMLSLGLHSRFVQGIVSTRFAADINGEPHYFYFNSGWDKIVQYSFEPISGKRLSKRGLPQFRLAFTYIRSNVARFDFEDIPLTSLTTLSRSDLKKYANSFSIGIEFVIPNRYK